MEETLQKEEIYRKLLELTGDEQRVQMDVPMDEHTTFRTGGPADVMAEPSCTEELAAMIEEQDGAELTCQFCDAVYNYTKEDLQQILDDM